MIRALAQKENTPEAFSALLARAEVRFAINFCATFEKPDTYHKLK